MKIGTEDTSQDTAEAEVALRGETTLTRWEQEDITATMTNTIVLEKEQLGSTEEAEGSSSVLAQPRKRFRKSQPELF